jgi:hypothetical protein
MRNWFLHKKRWARDILIQKYFGLRYSVNEDGELGANNEGFGIVVDSYNRIYVTGYTTTANSFLIITLRYGLLGGLG